MERLFCESSIEFDGYCGGAYSYILLMNAGKLHSLGTSSSAALQITCTFVGFCCPNWRGFAFASSPDVFRGCFFREITQSLRGGGRVDNEVSAFGNSLSASRWRISGFSRLNPRRTKLFPLFESELSNAAKSLFGSRENFQ